MIIIESQAYLLFITLFFFLSYSIYFDKIKNIVSLILIKLFQKMNKTKEEVYPNHIAIVPDANRRWAKERNKKPWQGHVAGAERTKDLLQAALDLNIKCFSMWGGSWSNLTKRPKLEIKALFAIYERYFKKLIKNKEIYNNQVKVNIIGRWQELLPKSGIKAAKELIEKTKDHNERKLNFFIAYNGTDEMIYAIRSIVKEARVNKNLKITPEVLENHLWTHDLPPVDLLIRTGSNSDPHNSVGFMMWHTANVQYYFTNIKFPDFGRDEFIKAIKEYQRRERRLGK